MFDGQVGEWSPAAPRGPARHGWGESGELAGRACKGPDVDLNLRELVQFRIPVGLLAGLPAHKSSELQAPSGSAGLEYLEAGTPCCGGSGPTGKDQETRLEGSGASVSDLHNARALIFVGWKLSSSTLIHKVFRADMGCWADHNRL